MKHYACCSFGKDSVASVLLAMEHGEPLDGTRKVSLLAKYGCTEFMARNLCARHGLMSPIYERGNRNGCWFCPNRSVASFAMLRRHHPALWAEIERLSEVPGKVTEKFNREDTVPDLRRKMYAYDADCADLLFKF